MIYVMYVQKWIEIVEKTTCLLPHLQELSEALNRYIRFRKALLLLL